MDDNGEAAASPQSDAAAGAASGTGIPPYIPFQTLLTFLGELKTNGLAPQIDGSVLRRFSGGTQNQLKVGLRYLGLVEGSKPTPKLAEMVEAYETPAFEPLLKKLLEERYPFVFALDLTTATPTMFADAFKSTGAKEDAARKCRTFFLHAAKRAGVTLGPRILTGSVPRASSNGAARKRTKAPKVDEPIQRDPPEPRTPKTDSGKEHPLVQGLLMTLPAPGKAWPIDARASWLRMASSIFENIYQGKGTVNVTVAGTSRDSGSAKENGD